MNLGAGQDWNSVVFSKKHTGAAASASKNVRAVRSEQLAAACRRVATPRARRNRLQAFQDLIRVFVGATIGRRRRHRQEM
jgi:hypothetical protein